MFPTRNITTIGSSAFENRKSLGFDGSGEHVKFGDSSIVDGLEDVTFVFWIKFTEDRNHNIISKGSYNTSGDSFYFNLARNTNEGRIRFSVDSSLGSGGFWYRNYMNQHLPLNKWHHLCCVYSKTQSKVYFYVNGIQYEEASGAGGSQFIAIPNTANELTLGAEPSISEYFKGSMSEVSIYNTDLSSNQIMQLYNGGNPYNANEGSLKNNLIAWWRMGDNPLDRFPTIVDSSTRTLIGDNLVRNPDFNLSTTGWEVHPSDGGGAISHETSITKSGAGALRCTFPGGTKWAAKTVAELPSITAHTFYMIEADVYIPSGWDGHDVFLSDGGTFANATPEQKIMANRNIVDVWQRTKYVFKTGADTTSNLSGFVYIQSASNDVLPSGSKFIIVDNATIKPVTGGVIGHTVNMTASNFGGDTY